MTLFVENKGAIPTFVLAPGKTTKNAGREADPYRSLSLRFSKMAKTIYIIIVHISCPAKTGLRENELRIAIFNFYFRATLGVKEVLQSSKNSTSIF